MGPEAFLGGFLVTFLLGAWALYYSALDDLLKILILFVTFVCGIILFIINLNSEKGYTLKKLVGDYGIKYGDTVDFTYHIRTSFNKDQIKIPKCKITGSVEKDILKIKTMENCSNDEKIKQKYLNLITTQDEFDNKEPIRIGSKIANFTGYGNIFD